jgi:hypothetical protein
MVATARQTLALTTAPSSGVCRPDFLSLARSWLPYAADHGRPGDALKVRQVPCVYSLDGGAFGGSQNQRIVDLAAANARYSGVMHNPTVVLNIKWNGREDSCGMFDVGEYVGRAPHPGRGRRGQCRVQLSQSMGSAERAAWLGRDYERQRARMVLVGRIRRGHEHRRVTQEGAGSGGQLGGRDHSIERPLRPRSASTTVTGSTDSLAVWSFSEWKTTHPLSSRLNGTSVPAGRRTTPSGESTSSSCAGPMRPRRSRMTRGSTTRPALSMFTVIAIPQRWLTLTTVTTLIVLRIIDIM